ncbi:H-NS histone family protein [Ruegeria arenilitoris]|uniref:DNA binding protein, nucleoid-associated n=1 Tax=Ruegeria arenilitoris TaxID=1173585 RepID=A0A238KGP5_9RHOB|nr:H-NS histone family protein [Ruegeria arenilitoris]SMX41216.1 DNA binding protein, nucleoid-associated [Ruegeria arenilitoris]
MGINLDKLSRKELLELRDQVDKALENAEARERQEALMAAEKAAAAYGFSLSDLASQPTRSGKGSKAKAKYRNPADPTQTWTGRGRKPKWVHEALKAGADISDLEI